MKSIPKISILGDGGWGTTLAIYLSQKGYPVVLWGPFAEYITLIKETRVNSKFLPDVKIPSEVALTADVKTAVCFGQILILAVPSQYLPGVLKQIKGVDLSSKIILNVAKGIDTKSLKRISETVEAILGKTHYAVLSGPNIATEVAKGIPSTAVIASRQGKTSKSLQEIFNSPSFRIYTNSDIVGVELGGSIKNIIAIACGVCDGLGFGTNTKSAIVTRGLSEMIRLGKLLGAKEQTFAGLSGLGDLVTTCFSPKSRNRTVGEELGKGKNLQHITQNMAMVAEGVETTKAVYKLSQKLKVSMPITTEVYNILYKSKKPAKAVSDLMSREAKSE